MDITSQQIGFTLFALSFPSYDKIVFYPESIGKTWSFALNSLSARFVFVLSICFSYSIFSLYSIFNDRGIRLFIKRLVGTSGLEPPTSRLSGARSNQLSYAPVRVEQIFLFDSAPFRSLKIEQQFKKTSPCGYVSLFQGFVLVYFQTTTITLMIITFSIERRWSSRTFRYGYLVTT